MSQRATEWIDHALKVLYETRKDAFLTCIRYLGDRETGYPAITKSFRPHLLSLIASVSGVYQVNKPPQWT